MPLRSIAPSRHGTGIGIQFNVGNVGKLDLLSERRHPGADRSRQTRRTLGGNIATGGIGIKMLQCIETESAVGDLQLRRFIVD